MTDDESIAMQEAAEHVAASILYLRDGRVAICEIRRGTEAECVAEISTMADVVWKSSPMVDRAEALVFEAANFDAMMEQEEQENE